MCESCNAGSLSRRKFLALNSAVGASALLTGAVAAPAPGMARPAKKPARVMAVFLYPPAAVVNAGQMEERWASNHWFTWPGTQFQPEAQQKRFTTKIPALAQALGVEVEFAPEAIYQRAKIEEFIARAKQAEPDAVLVVNFWNTLSKSAYRIAVEAAPTAIVYHSLGSNHQLPPESLRTAEGIYYIHSVDNFDEIERGLRAVRARKMLAQSRMLRVSGRVESVSTTREKKLDVELVTVPAEELNAMFDAISDADALRAGAAEFNRAATRVTDVSD